MSHPDPFDPSEPYYECRDCRAHVSAIDYNGACPDCGGQMDNINRPQE
jgi:Zn finger protein HypA/HybF involved in hydrogenase expression